MKNKNVDTVKYFLGNYDQYIDDVQKDFDEKIAIYEKKLKHWACAKVVCTVCIPIILVVDFYSTQLAIILTSFATYCEFYTKFLGYDDKIKNMNYASCKLTCEYNLYSEFAGQYKGMTNENAKALYVENTSKLIMEADIASYKMLNLQAMDEAVSKVGGK